MQHDQLIVVVHAVRPIRKRPVLAGDGLGMIVGRRKAACLQSGADRGGALQALVRERIVTRYEQRVAGKPVAVVAISTFEFPLLQIVWLYRVVMDRNEEPGIACFRGAIPERGDIPSLVDYRDLATFCFERDAKCPRQRLVEPELGKSPCAHGARLAHGVTDIHRDGTSLPCGDRGCAKEKRDSQSVHASLKAHGGGTKSI